MPRRRKPDFESHYDLRKRTSSDDSDSVIFISSTKRRQEVLKAKRQIFNRMQSLAIGRARPSQRRYSHFSTQTDESSFNCFCCERSSCSCLPGPSRRVLNFAAVNNSKDIRTLYENGNKDTQTFEAGSSSEVLRTVGQLTLQPPLPQKQYNHQRECEAMDRDDHSEIGCPADISASDTNAETNQHSVGIVTSDSAIHSLNVENVPEPPRLAQTASEPAMESASDTTTTTSDSTASGENEDAQMAEAENMDNTHAFGDGAHNDPLQVEIIDLGEMSVSEYLENLR